MRQLHTLLILLPVLAACDIQITPIPPPFDSGSDASTSSVSTSGATTSSVGDTDTSGAAPIEAGPGQSAVEAGPPTNASSAAEPAEAGPVEAGPVEAGPVEAGPQSEQPEAGPDVGSTSSSGASPDTSTDITSSDLQTSSSSSSTSTVGTLTLPPPPPVPAAVSPLPPGCGVTPQRCPQSGILPSGEACDLFGSDWWPYPAVDMGSSYYTPSGSEFTLNVEHVTPYGGWFTFLSPWSTMFGEDFAVCWSTSPNGLDTLADFDAALGADNCVRARSTDREGVRVKPYIVTEVEPGTTYYFRAVYTPTWPSVHAENPASNVVSFTTLPDPIAQLQLGARPRLAVTADQLIDLKYRHANADPRIAYWMSLDTEKILRAASPTGGVYLPHQFAVAAALHWHITGDAQYRSAALTLLDQLLANYADNTLTGNQYRWEGSGLAVATDLMWSELTLAKRQAILDAMLAEDEAGENMFPLFTDTDQMVSFGWIQIAHALTFMNDPDLDPDSVARMGAVFEHAVRRWYGVFHPKMRRTDRMFGLAGGEMDDGVDYARGTQTYWLETMRFLDNAGLSQADYSEWIWNHFRTHDIYGMLPDRSGTITWGDVEEALPNGGQAINKENWDAGALHICLLRKFCREPEAGYVRDTLLKVWEPSDDWGPHHWAVMCDDDAVTPQNFETLPLMYHSEGLGNVFDRTGWGAGDSYLFFSAGWRAVDHNHDDVGHFSLWSNGAFVVHEVPEYDENSASHNVLLMGVQDSQDYLWKRGSDSTVVETSTSSAHLYVLADMTSAYNFDHAHPGYGYTQTVHDAVTRSLFWDKHTDRVVIYDRVVGGPATNTPTQNFLGPAEVTRLYDVRDGDVVELLSVVNGTGALDLTADTIGVSGLVLFDRSSGELH